jgi:HSP20 family protein
MFDRDFFNFNLPTQMPTTAETVGMMPAVEIAESDSEFTCTAELPGLTEKEVEVSFDASELRIKGEKREEKESEKNGKRYHVLERSYGAFERTFTFPMGVDGAKISAEFKNGVLTVHLPKASNGKAKSRAIPIVTK